MNMQAKLDEQARKANRQYNEETASSPQEDWDKEYDEEFGFLNKIIERYVTNPRPEDDVNWGHRIKAFVRKTIISHEQKIREEERERILAIARDSLGDISYEMFRIAIEE